MFVILIWFNPAGSGGGGSPTTLPWADGLTEIPV